MSTSPAWLRRAAALSVLSLSAFVLLPQGSAAQVPALAPVGSPAPTPAAATPATPSAAATPTRRNVILFIADGLRRGSVNSEDTPTLYRLRTEGVDLRNSHAVFPTFTTANASVIATGHGLGDTGDFSNTIYPGFYLSDPITPRATDSITPFLEDDNVIATLNSRPELKGNYLGETTLLAAAHDAGYSVASIGKLGPVAIQLAASVNRDPQGHMLIPDTVIIDDSTGLVRSTDGVPVPLDLLTAFNGGSDGIGTTAPGRTNGYDPLDPHAQIWSNGFSGDAKVSGTLAANVVQEKWFADVATRVVLPSFVQAGKPFVLLFWSRDPDGTQHNQGDSLQQLEPGINGPTSKLSLRNADHCLAQLIAWLDQHPDIKANTDILVTSDHGFATISRKEIDAARHPVLVPSSLRAYKPAGTDAAEDDGVLPTGFLGVDLALRLNYRLFDASVRASTGDSPFAELSLLEPSQYPSHGSALLGHSITRLDGTDAALIIAANGGSDLIYAPTHDPAIVKATLDVLTELPYVNGLFVDDAFCPEIDSCPGALPLHTIGLKGATRLPTPAIVVNFTTFYLKSHDLQSAIQLADTNLQEGQGMHGGFGRDQTWNNMAAIGPDFKHGYVDNAPLGNIDIAPTVAAILGIDLPAKGSLKGRVLTEALATGAAAGEAKRSTVVSTAGPNGRRTVLDTQQLNGVGYYDRACMTADEKAKPVCPE